MRAVSGIDTILFLSTPSARRATEERGEFAVLVAISIHALREEGDQGFCKQWRLPEYFYPRPPRGGRLFIAVVKTRCFYYFYPRPPRGGRLMAIWIWFGCPIFLSTPSARRATYISVADRAAAAFLSTPSARRATIALSADYQGEWISIHALCEEGDKQSTK